MRVLIVEDDPLLSDALAAGLGFEVDWVRDGRDAQAAIRVEPFAARTSTSRWRRAPQIT
jgi:DNA-binding response OmpR family regulator